MKKGARNVAGDFKQRKLKVGARKLLPANVTNTSFKWSTLVVPTASEACGSEDTSAQSALSDLLSNSRNHNETARRESLRSLHTRLAANQPLLLHNLGLIVSALAERVVDPEPSVRTTVLQTLDTALAGVQHSDIQPFLGTLLAHISSALTRLHTSTRLDALALVGVLVSRLPEVSLVVGGKLLPLVIGLLEPQLHTLACSSHIAQLLPDVYGMGGGGAAGAASSSAADAGAGSASPFSASGPRARKKLTSVDGRVAAAYVLRRMVLKGRDEACGDRAAALSGRAATPGGVSASLGSVWWAEGGALGVGAPTSRGSGGACAEWREAGGARSSAGTAVVCLPQEWPCDAAASALSVPLDALLAAATTSAAGGAGGGEDAAAFFASMAASRGRPGGQTAHKGAAAGSRSTSLPGDPSSSASSSGGEALADARPSSHGGGPSPERLSLAVCVEGIGHLLELWGECSPSEAHVAGSGAEGTAALHRLALIAQTTQLLYSQSRAVTLTAAQQRMRVCAPSPDEELVLLLELTGTAGSIARPLSSASSCGDFAKALSAQAAALRQDAPAPLHGSAPSSSREDEGAAPSLRTAASAVLVVVAHLFPFRSSHVTAAAATEGSGAASSSSVAARTEAAAALFASRAFALLNLRVAELCAALLPPAEQVHRARGVVAAAFGDLGAVASAPGAAGGGGAPPRSTNPFHLLEKPERAKAAPPPPPAGQKRHRDQQQAAGPLVPAFPGPVGPGRVTRVQKQAKAALANCDSILQRVRHFLGSALQLAAQGASARPQQSDDDGSSRAAALFVLPGVLALLKWVLPYLHGAGERDALLQDFTALFSGAPAQSAMKQQCIEFACEALMSASCACPPASDVAAGAPSAALLSLGPPGAAYVPPATSQEWLQAFPRMLWSLGGANLEASERMLRALLVACRCTTHRLSSRALFLRDVTRKLASLLYAARSDAEEGALGPFVQYPAGLQRLLLAVLQQSGGLTRPLRRGLCVVARRPEVSMETRSAVLDTAVAMILLDSSHREGGARPVATGSDAAAGDRSSCCSSEATSMPVPLDAIELVSLLLTFLLGREAEASPTPEVQLLSIAPRSVACAPGFGTSRAAGAADAAAARGGSSSGGGRAAGAAKDDQQSSSRGIPGVATASAAPPLAGTGWGWELGSLAPNDALFEQHLHLALVSSRSLAGRISNEQCLRVLQQVYGQLVIPSATRCVAPDRREAALTVTLFLVLLQLHPGMRLAAGADAFHSGLCSSLVTLYSPVTTSPAAPSSAANSGISGGGVGAGQQLGTTGSTRVPLLNEGTLMHPLSPLQLLSNEGVSIGCVHALLRASPELCATFLAGVGELLSDSSVHAGGESLRQASVACVRRMAASHQLVGLWQHAEVQGALSALRQQVAARAGAASDSAAALLLASISPLLGLR